MGYNMGQALEDEVPLLLEQLESFLIKRELSREGLRDLEENLKEYSEIIQELSEYEYIPVSEKGHAILRRMLSLLDRLQKMGTELQEVLERAYQRTSKLMIIRGLNFDTTQELSQEKKEDEEPNSYEKGFQERLRDLQNLAMKRETKNLEQLGKDDAESFLLSEGKVLPKRDFRTIDQKVYEAASAYLEELRRENEKRFHALSQVQKRKQNVMSLEELRAKAEEPAAQASDFLVKAFQIERKKRQEIRV